MLKDTTPGFVRLSSIPKFTLSYKDLSKESIEKLKSTIDYIKANYPLRDIKAAKKFTLASILAEQHIAKYMEGEYYSDQEDLSDPWTYAFDVLSGIKYQGLRIEVKCSFSGKWINVQSTEYPGPSGINLTSFCSSNVADVMIILGTTEVSTGTFLYVPRVICTREAFGKNEGFVRPGKNGSFYLMKHFFSKKFPIKVYNT